MARIVERPKKNGQITYQVRWILGGGRARGNNGETENFADADSADTFRQLVDLHGQQWPPGWVRGKGFVEEIAHPDDVPLLDYAYRYVGRLNGVDERTREDYHREVRIHFSLIQHTQHSGAVTPATIVNVTSDDIADWVRLEQKGEPDPGGAKQKWSRPPADAKSIRNRHGLLYCIFQAAMDRKPPLRTDNPCKGTQLPRPDDHIEDPMCFLEREEYARVAQEIRDPDARDLADWLVGTGMRWGEATALQVRDVHLGGARPYVDIHRAWKKAPVGSPDGAFFLGPPKTKKARRRIYLTAAQAVVVARQVTGMGKERFVFRAAMGGEWRHSNFYHRKWRPAVLAAGEKGLQKAPRIHDLRHTHVAWLIAKRVPLPAIQLRLGHESIQTTIDRYGHLLDEMADEVLAAVEAAMAPPALSTEGRLSVVS